MTIPVRQIRAVYDADTIRVYQAYNDAIADSALAHGTFISPPYKKTRMTWMANCQTKCNTSSKYTS